jgi:hypothetical protein
MSEPPNHVCLLVNLVAAHSSRLLFAMVVTGPVEIKVSDNVNASTIALQFWESPEVLVKAIPSFTEDLKFVQCMPSSDNMALSCMLFSIGAECPERLRSYVSWSFLSNSDMGGSIALTRGKLVTLQPLGPSPHYTTRADRPHQRPLSSTLVYTTRKSTDVSRLGFWETVCRLGPVHPMPRQELNCDFIFSHLWIVKSLVLDLYSLVDSSCL